MHEYQPSLFKWIDLAGIYWLNFCRCFVQDETGQEYYNRKYEVKDSDDNRKKCLGLFGDIQQCKVGIFFWYISPLKSKPDCMLIIMS